MESPSLRMTEKNSQTFKFCEKVFANFSTIEDSFIKSLTNSFSVKHEAYFD